MTGMTNTKLLARYEAMTRLSQQMLDSARRQDWDGVIEQERTRADIVEEIRQADKLAWHGPDGQKKGDLIRAILACDEEIKSLAEDWMKGLRQSLASIGTERKLMNFYTAAY